MNANKQFKSAQVKEISEKIAGSKAMVIAEYAGLSVKELQELRKDLKASGVELKVYKNRLFKIAAKKAGVNLETALTGPNIYAFGMEDDISPAKVLAKFAKEHEALKMKVGTYEGKVIDSDELATIAKLPSYEEALTMLASSLLAPLKNIAVGLKMLVDENKLGEAPATEASKETPAQEAAKAEEAKAVVKELDKAEQAEAKAETEALKKENDAKTISNQLATKEAEEAKKETAEAVKENEAKTVVNKIDAAEKAETTK